MDIGAMLSVGKVHTAMRPFVAISVTNNVVLVVQNYRGTRLFLP